MVLTSTVEREEIKRKTKEIFKGREQKRSGLLYDGFSVGNIEEQ
jgi:hypothetical protein